MAITAIFEVKGECFVVIRESEYLRLVNRSEADSPLPLSLFDDSESIDADLYVTKVLCRNLKLARQAGHLTQAELAAKLKKSQAMVRGAEQGKIEIDIQYWEEVLLACKLPRDWKPGTALPQL